MKYIRTKDGRILDYDQLNEISKIDIDMNLMEKDCDIQTADTIEELCDEFVFIDEFFKREHRLSYSLENAIALCKCHDVDITTLRGAIWTDKGLIYVAEMNEKGELELL